LDGKFVPEKSLRISIGGDRVSNHLYDMLTTKYPGLKSSLYYERVQVSYYFERTKRTKTNMNE